MKKFMRPPVPIRVPIQRWAPVSRRPLGQAAYVDPDPPARDLGLALLLFGAAAASAFILRPRLSPGWPRTAAYVASGLFGVWGFLHLAAAKAEGTTEPPFTPGPVPEGSPGFLAENFPVTLDPLQTNVGGLTRNMWGGQEYEFRVRNNTDRPVALWAGLSIFDSVQNRLFISDPNVTGPSGRILMDVPAKGSAYARLTSPSLGTMVPQTVTVGVELFRQRTDREPFLRSEALPIKMAYLG